ncbi:MAG: sugar ABC transporter substrate-binding protein [Planctomycetota bacterium]|nr:sugar ABC transporter substrate-binding protein [Planctomycetota bacterium]
MWDRKQTLPLAGLLVLLAALVGCDGATDRAAEHEPDAAGEARLIELWAHQGQERENAAMRGIIDAFNAAHTGDDLRAEITFFPDRQYADKVSIASASGTLPDVIDIDGPYVGPWAAEGILRPIDALIDDELRADMLDSLIEQGTYEGDLYALGAFDSALVVYYNRDMIERAGLEPPAVVEEAWSWDEFMAALEAVKPHAAIPLSLHMDDQSDEWLTYAFSPLIWSNRGRLIDTETHRAVGILDGPAAVEAITRWQDLFEAGLAEATSTRPDPFSDGLAAFDWTGHWMLPVFESAAALRFGVMPLPRLGEEHVAASGSWCWGVSSSCADPEAAALVLQWLLDPEHGIRPIVEANGAVPGRRSAFSLFPEYEQMPRRLFRAQLQASAHPRPRTGVYLTLTGEFARALRDIALGAEVANRLGQAAQAVQRVLDRRQQTDSE